MAEKYVNIFSLVEKAKKRLWARSPRRMPRAKRPIAKAELDVER
jgi:hypothetical protein